MLSVKNLLSCLPPFKNKKETLVGHQDTKDIIREILKTHNIYTDDYDKIFEYFDTGDIFETSKAIWTFLRYNLTYQEESGEQQSVKSPAAILQPGDYVDCKHYSLFAGGILGALQAAYPDNWTWAYRFATDKKGSKEPTHVFVVVFDGKNEIYIDPCFATFDYKKSYNYYEDQQPMSLVRISGPQTQSPSKTIEVNTKVAWPSFLTCINENYFSLKNLLLAHPDITTTALKDYCEQNKYDYNQLINFLSV